MSHIHVLLLLFFSPEELGAFNNNDRTVAAFWDKIGVVNKYNLIKSIFKSLKKESVKMQRKKKTSRKRKKCTTFINESHFIAWLFCTGTIPQPLTQTKLIYLIEMTPIRIVLLPVQSKQNQIGTKNIIFLQKDFFFCIK